MDEFERAAVAAIVEGTMIGRDVVAQLPHAHVKQRTHDAEGRTTLFAVDEGVPPSFPANADLAADLRIAEAGVASASVIVREGRLRALVIGVPPRDWPARPVLLGRADEASA